MFADVLLALSSGTLLAFTVGPASFVLPETAVTKGFRTTVAFDGGVLLADVTFILIVYFATSGLLREIKDDPKLFSVGGLMIMTYGIISSVKLKKDFKKTIDNKESTHLVVPEGVNYMALFIKEFLLNFISIGMLGFWLGIIIAFGPKLDVNTNRILIFFTSIILVYLAINVIKILIAKRLENRLTVFHTYRIKRNISIILLILGVFPILQAFSPNMLKSTS